MFNLLPDELCQVCFHVHLTIEECRADDWAPHPDGYDINLGPCACDTNSNAEYVSHLRLVECDGTCEPLRTARHWHTRYDPNV